MALLLLVAPSPAAASSQLDTEWRDGPPPPQPLEISVENPEGPFRVEIVDEYGAQVVPARPPYRSGREVVVPLPVLPPGKFAVKVSTDRGSHVVEDSVTVRGTYGIVSGNNFPVRETETGLVQDLKPTSRRVPSTFPVLLSAVAFAATALAGPARSRWRRLLALPALALLALSYSVLPSLLSMVFAASAAGALTTGALTSAHRSRLWWVGAGVAAAGAAAATISPLLLVAAVGAGGCLLVSRPAPRALLALAVGTAALVPLALAAPAATPASGAALDPESCYELEFVEAFSCLNRALRPRLANPENLNSVLDEVERAERAGLFDFPEASFSCHGLAHSLGRAMARYQDPVPYATIASTACLSGYVHGMLEEAALMLDTSAFTEFILQTCDALPATERYQCVHGSGHAAFERTGANLSSALEICTAVNDSELCVDGALMSFVEQYVSARREEGWYSTIRPIPYVPEAYMVCSEIPQQWVDVCLRWTMRQYPSGDPDSLTNALSAGSWCIARFRGRGACAWGVATAVVPTAQPPTPGHAQAACDALIDLSQVCVTIFVETAADNMVMIYPAGSVTELRDAVCAGLLDIASCAEQAEARIMINPHFQSRRG